MLELSHAAAEALRLPPKLYRRSFYVAYAAAETVPRRHSTCDDGVPRRHNTYDDGSTSRLRDVRGLNCLNVLSGVSIVNNVV